MPGTLHMVNIPCLVKLFDMGKIFIPNLTNLAETQLPVPSGAESNPYMNDDPDYRFEPKIESVCYHWNSASVGAVW